MIRILLRIATVLVLVAMAVVVLWYAELLVWPVQRDAAMAPTIPACDGRVVAEGLTFKLRSPRSGDVVAIHAAESLDGEVTPDPDADDLTLLLRVAAEPGDEVVGRDGSVFVNGVKFDDVATKPFPRVELLGDQYFVLGDNRSASVDSRDFGPILEGAIFARALFVVWPLRDFGLLRYDDSEAPLGKVDCG